MEKLADAVREHLLADLSRMEAEAFRPGMSAALHAGQCVLVLDGLDEVPEASRPTVRLAVAGVIRRYRLARVIVTCRIRSYTGEAVLPNFQAHTLAPFDNDKVRAFTQAWYNAQKTLGRFDAEQVKHKVEDLSQAALGPDLRELSANPMMLTTMALIHQREIGLPKERVRLYSLAVEILLRRWQKYKIGEGGLAQFLKDDVRLREVMERLAYEAHQSGKGEKHVADLERGKALTLLEQPEYLGSLALAGEFLDYVDQRAGLLVGQGGDPKRPLSYSFPHRTFQEYLAGCHLIRPRNPAPQFLRLTEEGDYWALACRLGAEELLYNRRTQEKVLDLAYRLCPNKAANTTAGRRAGLWSANLAALVGREAITRDAEASEDDKDYLARMLPRLRELLRSDLTPIERAEAGVTLARLGEERKEVTTLEHMEFCFVPQGPFYMGSPKDDDMADDDEKTSDLLRQMDYDFWMSRYPITNAQFEFFVQAGGYADHNLWTEARDAKFWNDGKFKGRWDNDPHERPNDYGAPFNLSNHPVVGISWYEALAFTRWLEKYLRAKDLLAPNLRLALPSEAEWEKAGRGGLQIPTQKILRSLKNSLANLDLSLQAHPGPQQRYPWGNDPDPNNANYADTGIGKTSAVGCFMKGQSPYGCEEMSGNVWEWTRSLWQNYPYPDDMKARTQCENLAASAASGRVLRGGAFHGDVRAVRCSVRYPDVPGYWYSNAGFRVALLPLL